MVSWICFGPSSCKKALFFEGDCGFGLHGDILGIKLGFSFGSQNKGSCLKLDCCFNSLAEASNNPTDDLFFTPWSGYELSEEISLA